MKTFTIQREFKEEVTVVKPVFKKVDVEIFDITNKDIKNMEFITLRSYAYAMHSVINELLKESSTLTVDPQPIIEVSEPPLTEQSDDSCKRRNGISNIGKKVGVSSKYHYCFFNTAKKAYETTFDQHHCQSEIEAALNADAYLDDTNDINRPRNRNDFPEIMEEYQRRTNEEGQ